MVKIEPGEDIIIKLTELGQFLDSAFFTGIGALRSAALGYFDGTEYLRKEFVHPEYGYELLSLVGNITKLEENTVVHCHAQLSDRDYQVFGGHLFEGIVSVTAEIAVVPIAPAIQREKDARTGLNLWP
ncbi:MAG: PPC domain-containing DNA-binding protein [Candidatus Odinarchaeota archaeon]